MGVTVLHAYPVPADKTVFGVVELIQRRIVNLGANSTGQFVVDCETYFSQNQLQQQPQQQQQQQQRVLHVLHNSEHPATVFSIIEAHSGKPRVTFTSDTLFDLLLLKLSNVYTKKLRIESKGTRYEIGDFVVKLGIVSVSAVTVKGILVEVEYLPCQEVNNCWSLIHELMQGFIGSGVSSSLPTYLKQKGSDEIYSPADTALQYLEHFTNFRKAAGPGASATSFQSQQRSS